MICHTLTSKDMVARDRAREALILVNYDTRFLNVTFKSLHNNLERGYQVHVKIYTIHHLLDHLHQNGSFKIGMIDDSLKLLSEIIMSEEFGKVKDEKDTEDHKRNLFKEAKTRRG